MAELIFLGYIVLLLGGAKVVTWLLDWTYPSMTKDEKRTSNKVVKPW